MRCNSTGGFGWFNGGMVDVFVGRSPGWLVGSVLEIAIDFERLVVCRDGWSLVGFLIRPIDLTGWFASFDGQEVCPLAVRTDVCLSTLLA